MPESIQATDYPGGYVFTTDSSCDTPVAILKEAEISCIVVPYSIDGVEYRLAPGEDFDAPTFYDAMRAGKNIKTMAPNTEEFKEFWRPYLEAGVDVFFCGMSNKLSSTFGNACTARDELKSEFPDRKIVVVDSLMISCPLGCFLMLLSRKYKAGMPIEDLATYAQDNLQRLTTVFSNDTLEYFKRGGRVSATAAAVGTLLDIKPILDVSVDGRLVPIAKVKGHKKALKRMSEMMLGNRDEKAGEENLTVVYDADAKEDADLLEKTLREGGVEGTIYRFSIGPVVGAHCGPGTSGIAEIGKQRDPQK